MPHCLTQLPADPHLMAGRTASDEHRGRSLERQHGSAGLLSSRRLKAISSIRAASGPGSRDPARPSAPPLPQELNTSGRVKYPEVSQDSDYAMGQPGSREDQLPVDEATDQVQVTSHLAHTISASIMWTCYTGSGSATKRISSPCLQMMALACPDAPSSMTKQPHAAPDHLGIAQPQVETWAQDVN